MLVTVLCASYATLPWRRRVAVHIVVVPLDVTRAGTFCVAGEIAFIGYL